LQIKKARWKNNNSHEPRCFTGSAEYKTLLIDADPQANATSGVGFDPRNIKTSIYECVINQSNPKEHISAQRLRIFSCFPPILTLWSRNRNDSSAQSRTNDEERAGKNKRPVRIHHH